LNDGVGFLMNSLAIERWGWFFNEFIGNSSHGLDSIKFQKKLDLLDLLDILDLLDKLEK